MEEGTCGHRQIRGWLNSSKLRHETGEPLLLKRRVILAVRGRISDHVSCGISDLSSVLKTSWREKNCMTFVFMKLRDHVSGLCSWRRHPKGSGLFRRGEKEKKKFPTCRWKGTSNHYTVSLDAVTYIHGTDCYTGYIMHQLLGLPHPGEIKCRRQQMSRLVRGWL